MNPFGIKNLPPVDLAELRRWNQKNAMARADYHRDLEPADDYARRTAATETRRRWVARKKEQQ